MAERVRLRPMTQDEYAAYSAQSESDYAQQIADSGTLDHAAAAQKAAVDFAELLPDGLASAGMHLWTAVAEEDQEPVGIGWVELRRRSAGVSAYIYDIAVDPDHRGQGLGRGIMEALHDEARDLGATSISLNVFGHNTTAIHLYDSLGYAVTAQQMKRDL